MQLEENLDTPVWGAAAIGQIIGRNARQTFHLLESGALPAKKVGERWVASRKRLLATLTGDDAAP